MGSSEPGSGDDPDFGDGVVDLDEASLNWIHTFCTGFADVAEYVGPDSSGMSKDETITTVVDAYQKMSDAGESAVKDLSAAPSPTFPQHDAVVPGVAKWFESVATIYGEGSQTIADGTYSTPSDLTSAINDVEAQVEPANSELSATIGMIDPSVSAAIVDMPECSVLVDGTP